MTLEELDRLDDNWEKWELNRFADYSDDFIDELINSYPELSKNARRTITLEALRAQSGF